MNITRQFVNGRWEPPFTPEEEARRADRFAEMCASRQAPMMVGSERAFLADVGFRHHGLDDHPVWQQEEIIGMAKRGGVSVEGKRYYGGLADHRGPADPEAWCATQQDYIDTVKRRNLTVRSGSGVGGVNHEGVVGPPPTPVDLAPDIVNRLAKEYVAKDPSLATKHPQEIREMVTETHGKKRRTRTKQWSPGKNWKDIPS